MGFGFNSLSSRPSPIKLLIVATDGRENASSIYTAKEQIYNLSKLNKVPVIILGSLFADLDFMKETATKTGGVYIYNRTII